MISKLQEIYPDYDITYNTNTKILFIHNSINVTDLSYIRMFLKLFKIPVNDIYIGKDYYKFDF